MPSLQSGPTNRLAAALDDWRGMVGDGDANGLRSHYITRSVSKGGLLGESISANR